MADQGFQEFTASAKRVMQFAAAEAVAFNHAHVGTEHILLGLLHEQESVAARVLRELGVELDRTRQIVEFMLGIGWGSAPKQQDLTAHVQQALAFAHDEIVQHKLLEVTPEHLLLGLVRCDGGLAVGVLMMFGVAPDLVRQKLAQTPHTTQPTHSVPARAARQAPTRMRSSSTPVLDALSRDLTEAARTNRLDPVIGRNQEIERLIQILGRRTKNNAVLLGEPGVGKTAVVEGLAQRIAADRVPPSLRGRRLVALDVGALVAGTTQRGQFEERLNRIVQELTASACILFIDEMHTLVGAGAHEGAIDAANMLKPVLGRGSVQVVGATTLIEYRKYVEKDAALERRFQPILVEQPTAGETITMLRGIRHHYERFHQLQINDEALQAAATLSERYITDRFLPDKAIDLIDEAAAFVRLTQPALPATLRAAHTALLAIRQEQQAAAEAGHTAHAVCFQHYEKRILERLMQIKMLLGMSDRMVEPAVATVTAADIAAAVTRWTRIPVHDLQREEQARLLVLETTLHRRVVGQHHAIGALAKAIRRARAGLKHRARPVGTFLFLGPTGVGKTEVCKALAEVLLGSEEHLIRIDMSEFRERHQVTRLMGAPPGYVGYGEGGQLTEAVRRKPYAVVLLDELEKAHPDTLNILLHVLDEGRLTDGEGRRVDFRNTIIIMTSNLGTEQIQRRTQIGFAHSQADASLSEDDVRCAVDRVLRTALRPEFLNRIDATITFTPLTLDDLCQIVRLLITPTIRQLAEQQITLVVADTAAALLAERGYDPVYGARPLQRAITNVLVDPLSQALLEGQFGPGDTIIVDAAEPGSQGALLQFRAAQAEAPYALR